MNASAQHNGKPHVFGFARLATSLINSSVVACELALLAPSPRRRGEQGARPTPSAPEASRMHVVGAARVRAHGAGR
jgi:hypothetical protein